MDGSGTVTEVIFYCFSGTHMCECVHTSYLKTKKITHNLASLSDQKKGNKEFFNCIKVIFQFTEKNLTTLASPQADTTFFCVHARVLLINFFTKN